MPDMKWIRIQALLCLLLSAGAVVAQERPDTLAGRVFDASHAVLQGARVEVQPRGQTAASDAQGRFTIYGLPPGQYTVTVSYLGFTPFTTQVTIASGKVADVDAPMTIAGSSEQVTVRANREFGELEAINRERTADNI